jgi:hypothetical protein
MLFDVKESKRKGELVKDDGRIMVRTMSASLRRAKQIPQTEHKAR